MNLKKGITMLDELEKIRGSLNESLAKLQDQLEPVLKQANPSTDDEPCSERQPRSEVCGRMETHADQLGKMRQAIDVLTSRLDIPT